MYVGLNPITEMRFPKVHGQVFWGHHITSLRNHNYIQQPPGNKRYVYLLFYVILATQHHNEQSYLIIIIFAVQFQQVEYVM